MTVPSGDITMGFWGWRLLLGSPFLLSWPWSHQPSGGGRMNPYSLCVPTFLHPLRVFPGNGNLTPWNSQAKLLSAMGQSQLL